MKPDTESLSDVFQRVLPSVVVILTEERKPSRERPGEEEVENSIGTGFLISNDGLIMTASHVIEVVDRIIVRFQNGWEEEASVVAASTRADVALIRIENVPQNLQVAEMGDSDQVQIGDRVFVVGSPYGIEFTLTAGHISGRRTESMYSSRVTPIVQLQTDAAINQGNSGGPMFNMAGQVVGVVSHILTKSGGFEGLGFAVSINTAQEILLNKTAFWSGVEFYPIAGPLAVALNIPQGSGLLVQRVAQNAPAQRLGIRPGEIPVKIGDDEFFLGGDVVIAINGLIVDPGNVEQMVKIRQSVNQVETGGRIKIKVIRGGETVTLSTTK
jgi:S1-C subfamily serine protease